MTVVGTLEKENKTEITALSFIILLPCNPPMSSEELASFEQRIHLARILHSKGSMVLPVILLIIFMFITDCLYLLLNGNNLFLLLHSYTAQRFTCVIKLYKIMMGVGCRNANYIYVYI